MKIKKFFYHILPQPREFTGWPSAVPLICFSFVFAATCFYLEFSHTLIFSQPSYFWWMTLSLWIWWMSLQGGHGLSKGRSIMALITRLCLLGLFVMLLSGPRAVRESDALSVVYVVDLSDSVGESSEKALEYVARTVQDIPENDKAGLLVFGKNSSVELPIRESFPFEGVINSQIYKDGSNLEKSLSLAAALIPQDNPGRIVLISDGTATEGNVNTAIDTLKSQQIRVDTLPVQYAYDKEVWLEKLVLPKKVKMGETYESHLVLSALSKGKGKLTLRENDNVVFEEEVEYNEGKNQFNLPIRLRNPGYYSYKATLEVPDGEDGWEENNIAINYLFIRGAGQILLVTDPAGDNRDWEGLASQLKRAKRNVVIEQAFEFPRDPLHLLPYDCIIFCNVGADNFDDIQMQAAHDAVYNQGIGFLMIGGENSFGPGGYHRSPIETLLPVDMDTSQKKVIPKGALAIILHTCEFAQGNTWGKKITKKAIQVLGKKDDVGVLAFDYNVGDRWIFKLQPASNYNSMVPKINQAQLGDMPSFVPTMQLALQGLKNSDAALKHMIIISDGDPTPPSPQLVNQYITNKISLSMVAINPHGGQDISVMKSIAKTTGGNYYFPKDPNSLPAIFIKEAKTLKRSMIQNVEFVPTIEFPSPILKGIKNLPPLLGYVLTTAKPRATVILKGPETEQVDPILATWRYGTGSSAAFSSDFSTRWGKNWLEWSKYDAFLNQLITHISRVEKQNHLVAHVGRDGGMGNIAVKDYHPDGSFLSMKAEISGPQGRKEMVDLEQTGPQRYQTNFDMWGKGHYHVNILGIGNERQETVQNGFVMPYSNEYLKFSSSPQVLKRLSEETGGRLLNGKETGRFLFAADRETRRNSNSVIDWFLIALAICVTLDVGLRRIQLDWMLMFSFLKTKNKGASTETMGNLLKRKQSIHHGEDSSSPRSTPAGPPRNINLRTTIKKTEKSEPKKTSVLPDDGSTTSRLLQRKRQWQDDQDNDKQ